VRARESYGFEAIVERTDRVCDEHLNDEYKDLCRQATAALCRKRPSRLQRGRKDIWACAVVYAMARVNFLFDRTQEPHMTQLELCNAFGVNSSTASQKAALVMKALNTHQMDPNWCLPSKLDDNPLAWMIAVDGIPVDVRMLSVEFQEIAYKKGLIPYIPSQKDKDKPVFGHDDDTEIVYEVMDPSEIPLLNEHAEAILDAMRNAGEPLSRRQLLKRTGVPASEWISSLNLLMMHDLVEVVRCIRRGEVYQCKGQAREHSPDQREPKESKPPPSPKSMPFFGMGDQIDWSKDDSGN